MRGLRNKKGGTPKMTSFGYHGGKKPASRTCEMEWGEIPEKLRRFVPWGNPGTGGASHVDMVGPSASRLRTEWFTLGFPIEFTHRSSNVASWKTPKTGKFQWETSINTDDYQSATIKIATSYGLHPWYTCSFFWYTRYTSFLDNPLNSEPSALHVLGPRYNTRGRAMDLIPW
jgi:hypothetical protein